MPRFARGLRPDGLPHEVAAWRPRVSVRADFASGDRDPSDAGLQSFNPLFPATRGRVPSLLDHQFTDFTRGPRRQCVGLTLGWEHEATSTSDGVHTPQISGCLFRPHRRREKIRQQSRWPVARGTRQGNSQGVIAFLHASLERTIFSSGFSASTRERCLQVSARRVDAISHGTWRRDHSGERIAGDPVTQNLHPTDNRMNGEPSTTIARRQCVEQA